MGKKHSQRCRACKESVHRMLSVLYGAVEVNWEVDICCSVEDMRLTNSYRALKRIYEALKKHRHYEHFVRAKKLPRVDFYVLSRSLIVEFDESQHFTRPRDITLGLYPSGLRMRFPVNRWRSLCQELDQHDDHPPYRDEQRAWYDTLRDFAPVLLGKGEIARLYARDLIWCSLDTKNRFDIEKIKKILMGKSDKK